jgi:aryl-alcohol dehydrogenase-like predicted oxidoreductase
MSQISKLSLGTAQLGMPYGITNENGQPSKKDAHSILKYAKKNNIKLLDTAFNYGKSQSIIGSYDKNNFFNISTKIPYLEIKNVKLDLNHKIKESLSALKKQHLDYCFLHHPNQLLEKKGDLIWNLLSDAKDSSLISKVGFSLYEPRDLNLLLDKSFVPDVIQVPYNFFDRRFADSGLLEIMKSLGVEVHTRSVFLQGLLLADKENLPKQFLCYKSLWDRFEIMLFENGINKLDFLLQYVFQDQRVDKVVIGVSTKAELIDIIASLKSIIKLDNDKFELGNIDNSLIDPRLW